MVEGYKEMGASSVIGLGVQSALLGSISAMQAEQVISKQARYLKDWKRMYKSLEDKAESGKVRQQELVAEVASLSADLTQARKQVASQEFVLTEKDVELAGKDKELAIWADEATRIQRELEWERVKRSKAQAKAVEAAKKRE